MKKKIVGLSQNVFSWKDKKTGKERYGFNMSVMGPSKDYVGQRVTEVFVDDTFPSFDVIATCIDTDKHDVYIDTFCNIEYNEKGYIDTIEFNPKTVEPKPVSK